MKSAGILAKFPFNSSSHCGRHRLSRLPRTRRPAQSELRSKNLSSGVFHATRGGCSELDTLIVAQLHEPYRFANSSVTWNSLHTQRFLRRLRCKSQFAAIITSLCDLPFCHGRLICFTDFPSSSFQVFYSSRLFSCFSSTFPQIFSRFLLFTRGFLPLCVHAGRRTLLSVLYMRNCVVACGISINNGQPRESVRSSLGRIELNASSSLQIRQIPHTPTLFSPTADINSLS